MKTIMFRWPHGPNSLIGFGRDSSANPDYDVILQATFPWTTREPRLPESGEIDRLPTFARLALAGRAARRTYPLLRFAWPDAPSEHLEVLTKAADLPERISEGRASVWSVGKIEKSVRNLPLASLSPSQFRNKTVAEAAVSTILDCMVACGSGSPELVLKSIESAAMAALLAVPEPANHIHPLTTGIYSALRQDFEVLDAVSGSQEWDDETPLPHGLFPLHTVFETEHRFDHGTILRVGSLVDAKLLDFFRCHPKRLYSLSPRQFEEVIAELFSGFGFSVELTKRTRDGGRDIVAVQHVPSRVKYLIECKRYGASQAVGVAIVDRLLGVTVAEQANKGILATTARFTLPAERRLSECQWVLEGQDFDGIVQWLDAYHRRRMGLIIGGDSSTYEDHNPRAIAPCSEYDGKGYKAP